MTLASKFNKITFLLMENNDFLKKGVYLKVKEESQVDLFIKK